MSVPLRVLLFSFFVAFAVIFIALYRYGILG